MPPSLTSFHYRIPQPYTAHLVDELCSAIRNMSIPQIDGCAEYLSSRCQSKSLNVKTKALRAIKMFCQKAPPEFRRVMSKHSVVVRQCTSHSGPPDPLKGDAPHKQIRELANETVRAIFDASENENNFRDRKYETNSNHLQTGASTTQTAMPIIGDISNGADPTLNKTTGTWGGEERREGFGLRNEYASEPPLRQQGGFAQDANVLSRPVDVPVVPTRPFVQTLESPTQIKLDAESRGRSQSSISARNTDSTYFSLQGSEEQRRVDTTCARGGVRLAPSPYVLQAFVKACDGLRLEGVAAALAAKLAGYSTSEDTKKEAYKAACCVEACAASSGACGAADVARLFDSKTNSNNSNALRAAAGGGGALGEKAAAAVAAVEACTNSGRENRASGNSAGMGNQSALPATHADEVDFFGLSAPATTSNTAVDDLLGGLSLSGMPAQQSVPPIVYQQQMAFAQQQMVQLQMGLQQNMMYQNTTAPLHTMPAQNPTSQRSGQPMSPAALGGGQSAYTQQKGPKAFDFVSDLLGSERKK